jgi:GTP-binding protein
MTLAPRTQTASSADIAKVALAWAHSARFLTTASVLAQLPASEVPELAFVGRSNAGKSTAVNRLAQQRRLAFASRTPGRTQHINLFEVGPKGAPDTLFADLPGYGYAAVDRGPLHGVVLMVDSRLGLTSLDQRLLAMIAPRLANREVRLLVLLTKADKLNRRDAQAAIQAAQVLLGEVATENSDIAVTLFSALSGQGVADVAETLYGWTHSA